MLSAIILFWIFQGDPHCKIQAPCFGRCVRALSMHCTCVVLRTLWCFAPVAALRMNDAWIVHRFGPPTGFSPAPISSLLSQHWLTAFLAVFYSSYRPSHRTMHTGRMTDWQVGRQTWKICRYTPAHATIINMHTFSSRLFDFFFTQTKHPLYFLVSSEPSLGQFQVLEPHRFSPLWCWGVFYASRHDSTHATFLYPSFFCFNGWEPVGT